MEVFISFCSKYSVQKMTMILVYVHLRLRFHLFHTTHRRVYAVLSLVTRAFQSAFLHNYTSVFSFHFGIFGQLGKTSPCPKIIGDKNHSRFFQTIDSNNLIFMFFKIFEVKKQQSSACVVKKCTLEECVVGSTFFTLHFKRKNIFKKRKMVSFLCFNGEKNTIFNSKKHQFSHFQKIKLYKIRCQNVLIVSFFIFMLKKTVMNKKRNEIYFLKKKL